MFRGTCIALIPVVFLLQAFLGLPWIPGLLGWVSLLALVQCLPGSTGPARRSGIALLAMGIFLMLASRATFVQWLSAFTKNAVILAVMLTVPILGLPLRYGGYFAPLEAFYTRYVYSRNRLYLLSSVMSLLIGVLLNFAVVPIVYQLSRGTSIEGGNRIVSTAIVRGYGAAVFWAPGFISVGMMLHALNLEWTEILPTGLLLSALALGLGWLLEMLRLKVFAAGTATPEGEEPKVSTIDWRKLGELSMVGLILIVAILLVDLLTPFPVVNVIPLFAVFFPVAWSAAIGKKKDLKDEMTNYARSVLPNQRNDVVLFVSAGFFGAALQVSGLGERMAAVMQGLGGYFPGGPVAAILLSVIALGVIGVHPVIPITTYLANLNPAALAISSRVLAVTLISSWALGSGSSPFSGVNLLMSGQAGVTSTEIGLRWNLGYTLILGVMVVLILSGLQSWVGL
ncbi:hypothetical protein SY88_15650 [Clostridiales bacterium PH28_bin88]|nr:hypothetical protein SY88_15650 [Clostridiales bacterium PH28_bin88]